MCTLQIATAPCTLLSPTQNDDVSSILSSSSDFSVAVSRARGLTGNTLRKRGRPPKVLRKAAKPAERLSVRAANGKRKGNNKTIVITWRCPGCSKTASSFPSAASLLAHLPSCHKRSGGLAVNNHSPNRGPRAHWPMPLSLPGSGFGCATCGLLLASESRLDKHRRDVHETAKTKI